jgi:hypothetical protein
MARDLVTNDRTRQIVTTSPSGIITVKDVPEVTNKDRITAGMLLQKIDTDIQALAMSASTHKPTRDIDLHSLTDAELLALEDE